MKKPVIEPSRRRVGILKPDHLGDLVLSAQAFHWFDRGAAAREFNSAVVLPLKKSW